LATRCGWNAIDQFGPIDAWFTLATVTLTNTSQLYFDTSAWQQPPRLYRLVQLSITINTRVHYEAADQLTTITLLLAASSLSAATLYVSLESTNPTPPYTNWVSVHLLPSGVCNRSASFGTSASASQTFYRHHPAPSPSLRHLTGHSPDTHRSTSYRR